MTISEDQQRRQQLDLLTLLLDQIGDDSAGSRYFETKDSAFAAFNTTTWVLLERARFLEAAHTFGNSAYRMTDLGWLRSQELTGRLSARSPAERAIILIRALKEKVKGRHDHHPTFVEERELASETGLPCGWLHSALSSNLLDALYPDRGYEVIAKEYGCFYVPVTFGLGAGSHL